MRKNSLKGTEIGIPFLAFLIISFAFASLVIKDFSSPLAGNINDDNVWEYMGFYLAKNLSFDPFPQINFVNNQVFYPYGTNSVLQPWGIEQSLFYAILYLIFGIGPWLQIYYFLSVLLTALGTFTLLLRDYGVNRAMGAGFLVSFFNFYTILKYPTHFSLAVIHWAVLNFIADFLIVKRVAKRQYISLRLLLLRACLLILLIGLDLGYIAGFALVSFTLSSLFMAVLIIYRYKKKELNLPRTIQELIKNYKKEFLIYYSSCVFLLGLTLAAGYFYLPLAFQIAKQSKSFDFSKIFFGAWWINPLRLLIPVLPGLNPYQTSVFQQVFNDLPETPLDGMAGWFLLVLGVIGLWQSRKQMTPYIPLVITFILCLVYHPIFLPTLKLFPWFAFNRAAGRSTIIYPIILTLFALEINLNGLTRRWNQIVIFLLVYLACAEVYTAYSFKSFYQPYSFDKNFFNYMAYVKKQPGEAVLDWPFCAGTLCPYWSLNAGIYAQRRFHEKKVMGQYFARVHPSQVEPYYQAGWHQLFSPDTPDPITAKRQNRCFRPDEWSFFTDFFKYNDFAGINLYVDLLPEGCATEFYQRFGAPVIETKSPGAGRMAFIPKSAELRSQVNLALGASLKFGDGLIPEPMLNLAESDLLQFEAPPGLTVTGLSKIEKSDRTHQWRGSTDRHISLKFKLTDYQELFLKFKFITSVAGQDVVIKINGVPFERIYNLKPEQAIERTLKFKGIIGWNTVIFRYDSRNNSLNSGAMNEARSQAVKFQELAILKPEST